MSPIRENSRSQFVALAALEKIFINLKQKCNIPVIFA